MGWLVLFLVAFIAEGIWLTKYCPNPSDAEFYSKTIIDLLIYYSILMFGRWSNKD